MEEDLPGNGTSSRGGIIALLIGIAMVVGVLVFHYIRLADERRHRDRMDRLTEELEQRSQGTPKFSSSNDQ